MVFNVKNLEEALTNLGNLDSRDLILLAWVDTDRNCKPIVRPIRIVLPKSGKNDVSREIIRAINSKASIIAIIDEHKNPYRLLEAEEFARKSCEEVVKDGKREKGKADKSR